MSQHSEDRLDESAQAPAEPKSARILPFERPQSELQRAVQLRAQEAIDLDRDRDRQAKRPAPLRWLVVLAIAAIPVFLLFTAVDGILRVFYRLNETYNSMPAPEQPPPPAGAPLESSEPGVVLLQPLEGVTPPPATDARKAGQSNTDRQ